MSGLPEIRVIVCGSRSINSLFDVDYMYDKLDKLLVRYLTSPKLITVISGHARGADQMGEMYADERGFNVEIYPADWDKHGKAAGFIRNELMATKATHCAAFWDGVSKGTADMISRAKAHGLVTVVYTDWS